MRIFKHPAFDRIEAICNHDPDECDHIAKGWVPLLSNEQQERFDEIELEVELGPLALGAPFFDGIGATPDPETPSE